MTLLEELIRRQVNISTATTINRTTERIAEAMANEIVKDPQFKVRLKVLVEQAFGDAVRDLNKPDRHGRRKKAR